ncbi:MAG: hypothetical protein L6Q99_09625 [Planctomycetes bacterium]|nr:hypothetical protein [Planctomycetota bacterium]
MKIPVFVSCPTSLNAAQDASRKMILRELDRANLEPRALGRSDYPTDLPLREVFLLAKHCSGGVILGFEQIQLQTGIAKRGTPSEKPVTRAVPFPTPWNQLEAGILFGLQLPLLVFAEDGITGGVFDPGVTDVFIHRMPDPTMSASAKKALAAVFQKWQASVRSHYYR